MSERRPVLLSIVGWITVISGILQMIGGIVLLVANDDVVRETAFTADEVTGFGIGALVVGFIYLLVGRGMLNLNGFALGLGVFVSVLGIIGNLIYLLGEDGSHGSFIVSLILNVIVLVACLSGFSARNRHA